MWFWWSDNQISFDNIESICGFQDYYFPIMVKYLDLHGSICKQLPKQVTDNVVKTDITNKNKIIFIIQKLILDACVG